MVGHQHPGMHLPAGLGASLAERVEESLAVLVVLEVLAALVAAGHDMIHRVRVLTRAALSTLPAKYQFPAISICN